MTKKLIALAVIAAGVLAADSAEIAPDTAFETDDTIADALIADGLAKEDLPPPPKVKTTRARVLVEGIYGKVNDIVDLPAAALKQAKIDGAVDDDKAAVAYALSIQTEA